MKDAFGQEFPNIGAPAFRALHAANISSLEDLCRFTEKELLALHGFGPKALRLLEEALKERHLEFKKG